MPEGVIFSFLASVRRGENWHLNVTQHFHLSVTDQQIKRLYQYFKHYRSYFFIESRADGNRIEVQLYLYRQPFDDVRQDLAIVCIEKDNQYCNYVITAIRLMDAQQWVVKRTLFSIEKWLKRIQSGFNQESVWTPIGVERDDSMNRHVL